MDGGRHDHLYMQERRPQAVSKSVVCWDSQDLIELTI
jgi:hypothetical protein